MRGHKAVTGDFSHLEMVSPRDPWAFLQPHLMRSHSSAVLSITAAATLWSEEGPLASGARYTVTPNVAPFPRKRMRSKQCLCFEEK